MRLMHIDLQVSDVDAARDFFEKFFGLRCTYQREKQIAFFADETGFEFAVSNLFNSPSPIYPPDFHAGFILNHTSEVREIYGRLRKAGAKMKLDLGVQGPNLVFRALDRIRYRSRCALQRMAKQHFRQFVALPRFTNPTPRLVVLEDCVRSWGWLLV